jgi:hypothetical protein
MRHVRLAAVVFFGFSLGLACSDEDEDGDAEGSPDNAGEICEVPDDCFVDVEDLQGDPICLDRVDSGYCTHLCDTDEDCCAVEGECESDLRQVCAPFESTGMRMCFLSCEAEDLDGGDETEYCETHAHERFSCRSTGGGSENRKVCVPDG